MTGAYKKKADRLEDNLHRLEEAGLDIHSPVSSLMCYAQCSQFILNHKKRAGFGKCKIKRGIEVYCGGTPCERGR